jgi:hypothetical protein
MKIPIRWFKPALEIIDRVINREPARFYALLLFIALMFVIFVLWKLAEGHV